MTTVMLNSKILNGAMANVFPIIMVASAIHCVTMVVILIKRLKIVLQSVQEVVLVTPATVMAPVPRVGSVSARPGGLQDATANSAVWAVAKIVRPNEASASRLVVNYNVCVIPDILVNLVNNPVVLSTINPVLAMATVK